jgi:hypothetical protein
LAVSFFLISRLPAAQIIISAFVVYLLFVLICNVASVMKNISDYRHPGLEDLFLGVKESFMPALVFFAALIFVFFVVRFTIPLYLKMDNMIGMAAAVFLCWICLFIASSIQFYPAVYYRLGKRPLKSIKKCFIIFFDNAGFCFFILFFNAILAVFILLFPGCNSLFTDEALRLRLLKYDWLDEQKLKQNSGVHWQERRKIKIPWKELLAEEKEKTGNRTWKSFIFPWKD